MKTIKILLSLSICCVAILGDYMVFKSKYSESFTIRAVIDNSVHAILGLLSALLFMDGMDLSKQAYVYNIALCTIISSFIDLDHFIVAKSIYLKDLTNLKERGIFHCTTLWLAITIILLLYSSLYQKLNVYLLTYMIILAYASHHIRDSTRRGIWLYPYGHTPPLNRYFYLFLLVVTPNLLLYAYHGFKPDVRNVVQYSMIV